MARELLLPEAGGMDSYQKLGASSYGLPTVDRFDDYLH